MYVDPSLQQYHATNLLLAETCCLALVNFPNPAAANTAATTNTNKLPTTSITPKDFISKCVATVVHHRSRQAQFSASGEKAILEIPDGCPVGFSITKMQPQENGSDEDGSLLCTFLVQFDSPTLSVAVKEVIDTMLLLRGSDGDDADANGGKLPFGDSFSVCWVHDDTA